MSAVLSTLCATNTATGQSQHYQHAEHPSLVIVNFCGSVWFALTQNHTDNLQNEPPSQDPQQALKSMGNPWFLNTKRLFPTAPVLAQPPTKVSCGLRSNHCVLGPVYLQHFAVNGFQQAPQAPQGFRKLYSILQGCLWLGFCHSDLLGHVQPKLVFDFSSKASETESR